MNACSLYGGDDIGAVVFDVGSYSLKCGYAQEDVPKGEIPAVVGVLNESMDVDAQSNNVANKAKYYVDINTLCVPRKGMTVNTYMKDGSVDDFSLFEKVLDYAYDCCIQSESKYHPVLMSEAPSNTRAKRERLVELMFEKYDVPAFFLVKNAVLSAFASGRVTALVVDSGATHTSAVPVHDGLVLTHAVVKSPLGGDYLAMQCKQYLQDSNIDLTPPYMIANKEPVKEKEKPCYTKRNVLPVELSWHNYMVKRVIQDFQHSSLQVSESPYDEKVVSALPSSHYEFPTGYHQDFGCERYKISEALFDPSVGLGGSMLGVGHIVTTSVGMCDVDVRPSLYNNVVLTGGNSFIPGFQERLNRDLSVRIPNSMRLKLFTAGGASERRFGTWIGGSILASIGTFQQMWISSQEYKEMGASQIERKCP